MSYVSRIGCCTYLLSALVAFDGHAQENPRHLALGDVTVKTLDQNWSHEDSNWFYNAAQGSRLLPYEWFLHLEKADSTELFRGDKHIRSLGFLSRTKSDDNPHALPIGFIKDAPYDDGTEGLGVTCAACHTGIVTYKKKTAYLIDGGPTMGDMEGFLKALAAALDATAKGKDKFDRFAEKVLGDNLSDFAKKDLHDELKAILEQRVGYNKRNLSGEDNPVPFGHGRVDAFGAIFNEVSANFLEQPENIAAATAPVSYPCLWDAPQHDVVQWVGSASNGVLSATALGFPAESKLIDEVIKLVFGTKEIGAFGRNAGEVLGVFGSVEITDTNSLFSLRYRSTVNRENLLKIEDTLKTLWSPEWPAEFPPIEKTRERRGRVLFNEHCSCCHKDIVRKDPARRVKAHMEATGTDPTLHENFSRQGVTGRLEGRKVFPLDFKSDQRFGAEDPVKWMLKHVVQRAILKSVPKKKVLAIVKQLADKGITKKIDINAFATGYETKTRIGVGGNSAQISLKQIKRDGSKILATIKKTDLAQVLEQLPQAKVSDTEDESTASIEITDGTSEAVYKARPLNGVWATAPYLHNGSVPTLADLLKPAKHDNADMQRPSKFHVGSTEFDPEKVGFENDSSFPIFDTSKLGNSNAGHEYGVDLSSDEKLDLLEYLKSL